MSKDLKKWKQDKYLKDCTKTLYDFSITDYGLVVQERNRLAERLDEIEDQIDNYAISLQQMEEDLKLQELIYFCNYGIYPEDAIANKPILFNYKLNYPINL